MLTGYNHNLPYKNRVFHLQTEDGGPSSKTITSTVFLDGAVIETRKADYSDTEGASTGADVIRKLMEQQHRTLAEDLRGGLLDSQIQPFLNPAP